MATDKPATKSGDMKLVDFRVCKAENGFKVHCSYEKKNKTISQKAGWVPSTLYDDKCYVYTDKKSLLAAIDSLADALAKGTSGLKDAEVAKER